MRKVNIFLGILIIVIASAFLGVAVIYPMLEKRQTESIKSRENVKTETITYQKPETIEDYSSYASAEVDENGYLHIPDNYTVENVSSNKIKTRYVKFQIPAVWKSNISIQVKQFHQPLERGIHGKNGITKISFFHRYSVANKTNADDGNCGRLGILYLYDNKNNESKNKIRNDDTNLIHVGSIGTQDQTYEVYLYQPKKEDIPTDAESYRQYSYFEGIDWQGCILTSLSLESKDTQWKYANAYIKTYWFDGFKKTDDGISSGSGVPANYTAPVKESPLQNEVQDLGRTSSVSVNDAYSWPSSYESPWEYVDQGSAFPYNGQTATVSENQTQEAEQAAGTEETTESPAENTAPAESSGGTTEVPNTETTQSENTEAPAAAPDDTQNETAPEEEENTIELQQDAG